jgi:hypothetical protein
MGPRPNRKLEVCVLCDGDDNGPITRVNYKLRRVGQGSAYQGRRGPV